MAKSTKKSTHRLRGDRLLSGILVKIMLALLQFYRYFLSPWLGNQCRFYPSCSAYSAEAYREHGFIKGCILTVVRIAKCNPWHPGGFDEVPKKEGLKKHTPCCNTTQHHTHN